MSKLMLITQKKTILSVYSIPGASTQIGQQLTGIRIYRKDSNKSTPIFNAEKELTIDVKDKTEKKIVTKVTKAPWV